MTAGQLPRGVKGRPRAVDDTDMRILRELSQDSRQSQRALARKLRMSAPAVGERIARLTQEGVIRGHCIDIDWDTLGLSMAAFVDVVSVQGADQRRLMKRIGGLPSVCSVHVVTGGSDLRVQLRVRDQTHLREILFGDILPMKEVQRTETLICLEAMPHKNVACEMIDALLDEN